MMDRTFWMFGKVPYALSVGGANEALAAGHNYVIVIVDGAFFIRTNKLSLGLENFKFNDEIDDNGQLLYGPVNGDQSHVRVSSFSELEFALLVVEMYLEEIAREAEERAHRQIELEIERLINLTHRTGHHE
jgi:hypothetical protein